MNLRRSSVIFKRNIHFMRHTPAEMFELCYWPFFDLLAWGLLASFIQRGGIEMPIPIGYLIGAAMLWNIVWRMQNGINMAFLVETWWSTIIGLLASPMTPSEFIVGAMMWTGFQLVVQLSIMMLMAWLVFHFGLFSMGLMLVPLFGALMLFAVALAFFILGVIMRVGHGANAMAWGVAGIVQPLSAVYYPVSVLPAWARAIAHAMPSSHVFEAMRAVIAHRAVPWNELWTAMTLDAVYLVLAMWFCRRMFETMRFRGYVTRYA